MAPKRGSSRDGVDETPAKRRKSGGGGGGGRKVDRGVPNAESMAVVDDYSISLNQTNITAGRDNNKFYKIQVLEGGGKFYAWNRWGRVGEDGQNKMEPHGSKDAAIKSFKQKFKDKTKNDWDNRDNFKPAKDKYTIVETDESGGGGDEAPMGKLTEAQIKKGAAVLEKLKAALKGKKDTNKILELSSEFYTLVPTNSGRKKPPPIDSDEVIEAKDELLKFYMRMGFDEVDKQEVSPISGVLSLPLPKSLKDSCVGVCSPAALKPSEKKGKDLASKQAGKPTKKMDESLYGAIMLYTSNAIYTELNKALRDAKRGSVKKYFKYLRLLFEAMSHLPEAKCKLWRGLSVDLHDNPQYKVGGTVTWWGVSSCTLDKNVANSFAAGCGGGSTVVEIQAKRACDITPISFYANEKESLLAPGTQFKVTSKTKKGGITYINMEEIGRAID